MQWGETARRQGGVITRRQLRTSGLSDSAIGRLAASGALERHARGVFVVRGAPVNYRAELWLAVLTTNGALGFGTAAHLWGMADWPRRIDVIIGPHRRCSAPFGIRLRHVFVPS